MALFTHRKQEKELAQTAAITDARAVEDSQNGKGAGEVLMGVARSVFDKNEREVRKLRPMLHQINAFDFSDATDEELKAKSEELKTRLRDSVAGRLRERGFDPDRKVDEWLADPADDEYLRVRRGAEEAALNELLPEAFALVREVASRTIQLRPFDVQCLGGIVLHQGKIAEMKTGEGKTLTATMPVYLNALTGRGAHVVTVNDYLAERDANWMRPIYEFLGLKVAFITNNTPPPERKAAYNADVLYVTNSEVGFDYLRDNMANSREYLVQRPLNYAIVDEVDNILIDEARTPLIISAQVELSDRARKRRSLAKLCDLVARKVMPATTDQEVQKLIDRHTRDNKISIDSLTEFLRKQGCLEAGLNYLIDCFLASESSARTLHVGKLVAALMELRQRQLVQPEALVSLSHLTGDLPTGEALRQRILEESKRVLGPYIDAALWVNEALKPLEAWDSSYNRQFLETLEKTGVVRDEAIGDLDTALDRVADINQARQQVLEAIFLELEKRELADAEGERALLIACLEYADVERINKLLMESVLPHAPLCSQALALVEEFIQWQETAAEESTDNGKEAIARRLTEIIEQVGVQRLLPADAVERLWELAKIRIGSDGLRREIFSAAAQHPGEELLRVSGIAASFAKERDRWLQESSEKMGQALQSVAGLPRAAQNTVVQKARGGGSGEALLESLRAELMKITPNSDVLKAVRKFATDQTRHAEEAGNTLVREMSEWIEEIPRDLRKAIVNAFVQIPEPGPLKERLSELVRDLPGDTAEIPSLINEAASQIAQWNQSNVDSLIDAVSQAAPLPTEALNRMTTLVEQGVSAERLEEFVSTELLHLPANQAALQSVQSHTEAWEAWLRENKEVFLSELGEIGSEDLQEQIRSLVKEPIPAQQLPQRVVELVVEDLIGRNLEPLLAPDNAPAFVEELRRRVPFSKDILGKMRSEQFAGKNKEQLMGHIFRLVQQTLGSINVEDFPRTIKTLGWYSEKDEKQRASALTDMGALIAEREIGSPAFPDPDGFADVLLETGVLREDEYQYLTLVETRGDGKGTASKSISFLINEHLRLEPARRRRVNELKTGEVSSLLDQAIKAYAIFERDVHYVVQEGREIVIVDEFTGRLMPGRRWSDGLHEAVEAKHGVEVRLESQTVATITIQNYFRIYYKLAGMTGTARTEEAEFINTYKLEVISIPTNKPIRRRDHPDMVFKTAEAKFRAITLELLQMHWRGQPVLVGTRSVEVSERLSDRLKGPALQLLTLTVLIKTKLWEADKSKAKERDATLAQLNVPLPQLNVTQVRNLAKELGISVDVTTKENLDKLESLLENGPGSRDRLITALRNGIPHNVLNAKNHKNEARIIAEAARIGAITIATNMAGRGVDIVLGGTLDEEAKIRVISGQIVAQRVKGEFARVRSRTDETTAKLLQRLTPAALQDLCWCLTVQDAVSKLQAQRTIDSYQTKELFDALVVSLDSSATRSSKESEVRNRVRSRARRLNCADSLPLDDEALTEERLRVFAKHVNVPAHDADSLRAVLTEGIPAYVYESDVPERLLLQVLLQLLNQEKQRYQQFLNTLPQLQDLDKLLLEAAAWGNSQVTEAPVPRQLKLQLAKYPDSVGITEEWVKHRLEAFDIVDAGAARARLSSGTSEEIEVNDRQILALVRKNTGEVAANGTPDLEWVHEKLKALNVIRSERKYVDEDGAGKGDATVTHYRLDRKSLATLSPEGDNFEAHIRGDVIVEMLKNIDPQAPWANIEWVDHRLLALGIIQSPQEVRTVTVRLDTEDDAAPTVEIPAYRISGQRLLQFMEQPLIEATIHKLGDRSETEVSVEDISQELIHRQPLIRAYVNDQWILKRLTEWKIVESGAARAKHSFRLERKRLPTVLVESGVPGQSADWVLVGEKRPEDVIQTSEYHEVKALGGLHVLGTERHESRRIDNQLRGRSGRQGDPGTSRFYVSWEDELIRLFASPPKFLLDKWYEDEAIEHKWVTKSIERAQKKVEINHFEARKHTLEYDDVMNIQRDVIYKERRKALLGGNLRDRVLDMITKTVSAEVQKFASPQVSPADWDLRRLHQSLSRLMGVCRLSDYLQEEDLERKSAADIQGLCVDAFQRAYEFRETDLTLEMMRELERLRACEAIDEYWMQHLAEMDSMREGINLRAYGQREPLLEYRREAFELFGTMMDSIQRDVTEYLFIVPTEAVREFAQQRHQLRLRSMQMRRGEDEAVGATETFAHAGRKVGRNEPCPCGSGKKYKKCCMLKEEANQ